MKLITNDSKSEQPFSIKTIIGPMLAIIVGMIMVILDSTVMNVAIPGLVKDFHSSLSTIQWVVTGYTLAQSAVIPLAGWMTDRFGAKRIFLITVLLFTAGSVLCSFATTPEMLIAFRVIQGLGGGMMAPIGMAIVFRLAPADKFGSVMGMLGVPMLLAPALGPILSGWLIEYASWHWIFLINLPIGIIALIIGIRSLPNLERKAVPALDYLGMILGPIAFATLAYAVSEGGRSWTSVQTITSLSIGLVALLLFIVVELRHKQPLLELRVFASWNFTRGIVITWVSQFALFGSMLLLPLFLQSVKGYGALTTGQILMTQAIVAGVFLPIGGRLYDKVKARPLAVVGMSLVAASLFMLSKIDLHTSTFMVIVSLALAGAGMGLGMMSLNSHVLQSAPRELVSRVTSLTSAAQQVIVSFAAAGVTGFLTSRMTHYVTLYHNPMKAAVSAFDNTFLLASGVALCGALLGFTLRKPKMNVESEEMKTAAPMLI